MSAILFTHIPKTAGSSLHHSLFGENIPNKQARQSRGLKDLITERSTFQYLHGHYPYGVHKIAPVTSSRYFVVLRDPVERALSFYHDVLYKRGRVNTHPSLEDARNHDIVDFYRLPRYQNVQARFVAGMFFHKLGTYLSLNGLKQVVYWTAKRNLLHAYEAFGLTQRYKETAGLFARKLGWSYQSSEKRYKTVPDRPTTADLTVEQTQDLRRLNAIDMALYKTACAHFDEQMG